MKKATPNLAKLNIIRSAESVVFLAAKDSIDVYITKKEANRIIATHPNMLVNYRGSGIVVLSPETNVNKGIEQKQSDHTTEELDKLGKMLQYGLMMNAKFNPIESTLSVTLEFDTGDDVINICQETLSVKL